MTFTEAFAATLENIFNAAFTATNDGGKTLLQLDGKTVIILGN